MKTRLLTALFMLFAFTVNVSAQYCGNADTSLCNSIGSGQFISQFHRVNSICVQRLAWENKRLGFKVDSIFKFQGNDIRVNSLRLDSIGGLPPGMCWSTSKSSNIFEALEDGCLRFYGMTAGVAGQYRLKMFVTLYTNTGIIGSYLNTKHINLEMYVVVKDGNPINCPLIDTALISPYDLPVNADSLVYISGVVYNDANNSGSIDSEEVGLPNVRVNIGSVVSLTNSGGYYGIYVMPGIYTIAPQYTQGDPISFPLSNYVISADSVGVDYNGNNFAAIVSPTYCVSTLSMANVGTPPRPGFDNTIQVRVVNIVSANPLSFTLRLYYNPLQTYISSTKPTSEVGISYLEWNISNLANGNTWDANVEFNSPTTLLLGGVLSYSAIVQGLGCNNMDTSIRYELEVVGSYDPNDKAVSPVGYGEHHGINPNQVEKLTYKIRFQNTGTFLAEKVVIVDTISSNLDLTTLQVLSASHNYDVAIGDDRTVKFIFDQIMLPDSNSNEPESHGYVQYSIKLKDGLTQNTAVTNKADIYFDFNDPIRTNTAYNTIDFTTGIKEATPAYNFSLFPNPTTGNVQITADEQLVGKELKLTDISGRILLQRIVDTPVMTIQLSNLANGVYLMQIKGATKKIVKE